MYKILHFTKKHTFIYKLVIDLVLAFVQSFGLSFGRCCIEDLRSEPIWSKSGPLWLEKAYAFWNQSGSLLDQNLAGSGDGLIVGSEQ